MKYGRNEHERKTERAGRAESIRCDRADYIPAGRSERQFGICKARAAGKKSRIKEKAFRKLSGLPEGFATVLNCTQYKTHNLYSLYC